MISVLKAFFVLLVLFCVSFALQAEVADGLSGGFKHPPMTPGADHNGRSAAMMQPEGPVEKGKVVEVTSAAGYTYLLLQAGGEAFWVAGTQVDAKVGDVVSYIANVTMHDFTSRSINKTFDRIIFASMVKVVK
ncbi:MAG TPA: hypothetical protein ENK06_08285 [Gammaproteobacteria bacterium]|nr:hypothetical protein [Gammaproteobacteria bacterium]